MPRKKEGEDNDSPLKKSSVSGRRASDWEKQGRTSLGKFAQKFEEPLAARPVGARLPQSIHDLIDKLPNKSDWIRKVLIEAAERELKSN